MNGLAIATTVPSRATMITPSAVATSVHHGLPRRPAVAGAAGRVAVSVPCVISFSLCLVSLSLWQRLTLGTA